MRKDWDAVKPLVCKLSEEGKSLPDVRRIVQEQTGFKASTRAFRYKLGLWKCKREDLIPKLRTQQHAFSARPEPITQSPGSLREEIHDEAPKKKKTEDDSFQEILERIHSSVAMQQPANEVIYPLIIKRPYLNPIHTCRFENGTTSILHFAIMEASLTGIHNSVAVEQVVKHMVDKNISFDHIDFYGRTALEIAIRTDQPQIVELLLHHGASAKARTSRMYTPLHIAALVGAGLKVHAHLLGYGADINSLSSGRDTTKRVSPLQLALRQVQSHAAAEDAAFKWLSIVTTLTASGRAVAIPQEDAIQAVRIFFAHWRASQTPLKWTKIASDLIIQLTGPVIDPWETRIWPEREQQCCTTMMEAALFHSPNGDLARLLMQREPSIRSRCISMLIDGCTASMSRSTADILAMLMEDRALDDPVAHDLALRVVKRTPDAHKTSFLRVLAKFRWSSPSRIWRCEMASALGSANQDARYEMADCLFGSCSLALATDAPWFKADNALQDILRRYQNLLLLKARSPTKDLYSEDFEIDLQWDLFPFFIKSYDKDPIKALPTTTELCEDLVQSFHVVLLHIATKLIIPLLEDDLSSLRSILDLRRYHGLPTLPLSPYLQQLQSGIAITGKDSPGPVHIDISSDESE